MADDELEDTGTTLPRRQLGRLLRDARTATGMSLEEAAALVQWSRPTLSRLERGETEKVRFREILALCEVYGLDEERTGVARGLAELAPVKSWWHAYSDLIPAWANLYVGLESSAKVLTIFQPLMVHGLLQTADYARAVDRLYFPDDTDDEIERRVQVRVQRQRSLTRSREPTTVSAILHENVLRTVVGNDALMASSCFRNRRLSFGGGDRKLVHAVDARPLGRGDRWWGVSHHGPSSRRTDTGCHGRPPS